MNKIVLGIFIFLLFVVMCSIIVRGNADGYEFNTYDYITQIINSLKDNFPFKVPTFGNPSYESFPSYYYTSFSTCVSWFADENLVERYLRGGFEFIQGLIFNGFTYITGVVRVAVLNAFAAVNAYVVEFVKWYYIMLFDILMYFFRVLPKVLFYGVDFNIPFIS